jgi:hypothetical protein
MAECNMSKSDSGGKKLKTSSNPNIYEDNRKHSARSGGQKKSGGARISAEERQRKREERADAAAKFLKGLGIFLIIVLMAVSAVTGAAAYVTYSDTVFPNVSIDGVLVSGLTREEIPEMLEKSGWDIRASLPLTVKLMGVSEFQIDMSKTGVLPDKETAADLAFAYGHEGNWYLNLIKYLKGFFVPVDVAEGLDNLDRDYIAERVEAGIDKLNSTLGSGGYEIDKENSVLRMIKGAGDFSFDNDAIVDLIIEALNNGTMSISYDTLARDPEMPDFEKIHEELAREPVDAHFSDDNTFTIIDDIEGCEFDVDEAESIWSEGTIAKEIEIPLTLSFPEVTAADLESLLFRDVLGERTTYFPNSNDNRINNLMLASSKINNYILYPGEVFSYNDVVGERTEAAGFLPAGAYSSGEVVEEIGGGVCQVSSTLYCAMLYGYKLTTVERSPHYFPSDYIEKGYDATVSWPSPHFKFRNDTDYPVKIVANCDAENRALTVQILGTNIDGTHIETRSTVAGYNNTKYPWLFEGYGAQVFRDVYDKDGNLIETIAEIYDVYHTHEFAEQYKALEEQAAAQSALTEAAG